MSENSTESGYSPDEDPDTGPGSRPTGAAAHEGDAETEDPDAGPASEPQE